MGRRMPSRLELRAAYEAAERRAREQATPLERSRKLSREAGEETQRVRELAGSGTRMVMVWAVCDAAGRTVVTFPYRDKTKAEDHARSLKTAGKGGHFVRALKQPIEN